MDYPRHTDRDTYDFLLKHIGQEDTTLEDRWNSTFEYEPTNQEIEEFVDWVWNIKHIQALKMKEERHRKRLKKMAPSLVQALLITISIDQDAPREEINKDYCEKIMTELRIISLCKTYEYLRGQSVRFEFWTEKEKKPHWNPHFHIMIETNKKQGEISLPLRRKFVKKKWKIYNVNTTPRNTETLTNYVIEGNKQESKKQYVEMDNEYKRKINIPELYII